MQTSLEPGDRIPVPETMPAKQPANQSESHLAKMMSDVSRVPAILEIAKIVATGHDLDTMVSRLLSCLVDMLAAADAGVILLYDSVAACLNVFAAQGYDLSVLRQLQLTPGESISGRAFRTERADLYGTPEAVAEGMATMRPENRDLFERAAAGLRQPRSAVALPLCANDHKVGVLVLENLRRPFRFTQDDLGFLEPVADLLALAIDNARLRDELEQVRSIGEANRLKAEIISTLAHEMRTPLTSIKGYSTALLLDEATFQPETQREFLKIIDEECDVLQDLIHDLLESSIIDAGFLKLDPQPVLLNRLAKDVVEEFMRLNPRHRFLVDFPLEFPIVDADPMRITQVLRNLLDNSVKYSPEASLVVVRGEFTDAEVTLSVADQGEGIAPEHLNHLFDKFFRIKSGLGRHVVGTGLGLPIARTIVDSHGGRIWAESRVGEGTTLSFTLPRQPLQNEL